MSCLEALGLSAFHKASCLAQSSSASFTLSHKCAFICSSHRCKTLLHTVFACKDPLVTRVTFPIRSSSLKQDPYFTFRDAPELAWRII